MNNKDIMGDAYEYLLGKIAAAGENGQFRTPRHIINMMLHGVEDPHTTYQDSLSGDNSERDAYTLIMSNPPFTGSVFQEEISKDLLALTKQERRNCCSAPCLSKC